MPPHQCTLSCFWLLTHNWIMADAVPPTAKHLHVLMLEKMEMIIRNKSSKHVADIGFCLAKLQPTSQKRHLIESEQEPGSRMVRVRRSASDNDCPICMDPAKFAVETNCGHMYCCK
nr:uncharacterized protein LOC113816594 isoform X2 [Penaeus vannamei]